VDHQPDRRETGVVAGISLETFRKSVIEFSVAAELKRDSREGTDGA